MDREASVIVETFGLVERMARNGESGLKVSFFAETRRHDTRPPAAAEMSSRLGIGGCRENATGRMFPQIRETNAGDTEPPSEQVLRVQVDRSLRGIEEIQVKSRSCRDLRLLELDVLGDELAPREAIQLDHRRLWQRRQDIFRIERMVHLDSESTEASAEGNAKKTNEKIQK